MIFRRRTFPEVLDNLLTRIVGGQAAEAHPFPPTSNGPPYRHDLRSTPVANVISVYGARDGGPHQFRPGADYTLEGGRTVAWTPKAELPDPGTLVSINYYPASAETVLTDIQTGSVVRTLAESLALELASLYAQLQAVYDAGFIDTATGRALDNVVSLLGVERVRGGKAAGEVEFTRSAASRGAITIPAGTRVMTADGKVEYETVETVTLSASQNSARALARDLEKNDVLPAGALTVLPAPIAGIDGVSNPAPTAIATQDESDAQLRARAKSFLHGSERATRGALIQAFAEQGVSVDVNEVSPGRVELVPHVEKMTPELYQRLDSAKKAAKPAGVWVEIVGVAPPRKVNLKLRLKTADGLIEADLKAAQRAIREKIQQYFAGLAADGEGSVNRLVGLVMSVPQVSDVRVESATWTTPGGEENVLDASAGVLKLKGFPTVLGELTLTDPNLPTRLNVVVLYPKDATAPSQGAVTAPLSASLDYLNQTNSTELPGSASAADKQRRVVSYRKLLNAIAVPPSRTAVTLQDYDDQVAAGKTPDLPDETSVQPYRVQFVLTRQDETSRILSGASGPDYPLEPLERLSLSTVEVKQEGAGG